MHILCNMIEHNKKEMIEQISAHSKLASVEKQIEGDDEESRG